MNHALPHTSANLQGKTAIVTGATQGLGTDIAKVLVAAGAHVYLVGRGQAAGQQVAQDIGPGASFVQTDISSDQAIDDCIAQVVAERGSIDLLVNNAVYQDRESNAMLLDLDDDALQRTLLGNVVAPFWHPIRLAGEAAMADIIMDGRLDLGIARGAYSPGCCVRFVGAEQRRAATARNDNARGCGADRCCRARIRRHADRGDAG